MEKVRLLRIATVPISLRYLLGGQLNFMQQHDYEVLAVSAGGTDVSYLRDEGINHHMVPFTRSITPFRDLVCFIKLILLIRNFRPDIVHTHTPKAGLLGMLAAWISRVPIRLHTVAGLPLMEAAGLKRWILILTERITYTCSTKVYPNSIALREYIISKLKTQNSKLGIIGNGSTNGINLDYFQSTDTLGVLAAEIRNRYGMAASDFVYCFVGRVVRDKGINELITSFVEMAIEEKKVWLILVGHFEDELDPLAQEIKSEILAHPRIIHAGFQDDVRPWIMASDVFVLPSYREGFPNVVLQAGALEKACIVSNINGCNEIISHNKTGLLVEPKNITDLRKAMIYALQHTDEIDKMGIEARKFIAVHFDQTYLWNELLKEYHYHLNCVSQVD
jgi:glycosyltransferase involved in cell wall biosynthesis